MKVYFDNAATTRVADEVVEAMEPYLVGEYGNPASLHSFGRSALEALDKARERIAKFISCSAEEVVFVSGGTEANNMVLRSFKNIIVSKMEHPSVLETCKALEKEGCVVKYVSVDKEGIVLLDELEKLIDKDTELVSIMWANNETGVVQPVKEISEICKRKKVLFHTDAVQALGKERVEVNGIDMMTLSAHKVHGPRGVGVLYVREGVKLKQLLYGGDQEYGRRAGTINVAGAVGFAVALELDFKNDHVKRMRDRLIKELQMISSKINGHLQKRLCNIVNVSFPSKEGESVLLALDKAGIAVSIGSACSSYKLKSSHVLKAMGLSEVEAHGAIRVSLSRYNTMEEVEYFISELRKVV